MRYLIFVPCFTLMISVPSGSEEQDAPSAAAAPTVDPCGTGDAQACKARIDDIRAGCKVGDSTQPQYPCSPEIFCEEELALTKISADQACADEEDEKCKAAKGRLETAREKSCHSLPRFPILPTDFYAVKFNHHVPGASLSGNLISGGWDKDQQQSLFLCSVNLIEKSSGRELGIIPGKLLKGRCNVSSLGSGTEFDDFTYPVALTKFGHWGHPRSDMSKALNAGQPILFGTPSPPAYYFCHAGFTESIPVFNVLGIPIGNTTKDHGTQVGRLEGGKCTFEFGGQEKQSDVAVEVYFAEPPPPPPPAPKPPSGQPVSGITIASCGINPSTLALGASTTLTIHLSKRAPVGGVEIAVNLTTDGSADNFVNGTVNRIHINAGQQDFPYPIPTRPGSNPAHNADFILTMPGSPQCGTHLQFN